MPQMTVTAGAGSGVRVVSALHPDKGSREVGRLAVWSVTSAKPGNGVELLRDGRDDTYWQSDGTQPHLINIHFQKKVFLGEVALLADYKLDESYTPARVSVRIGNSFSDLREVVAIDLHEPQGWVVIPLAPEGSAEGAKGYLLQLAIISNHQNGRDTHIRQVKVYGPRSDPVRALGHQVSFTTPEFHQYATVR